MFKCLSRHPASCTRTPDGSYRLVTLSAWLNTDEEQKSLIFYSTIPLEFHITAYLWCVAIHCGKNPPKLICMYNSLNFPSYNGKTLDLLHNNLDLKILFYMDCLCVCFNCKYIWNVIIMGETKDMNEYIQKSGHPGWDCEIVKDYFDPKVHRMS